MEKVNHVLGPWKILEEGDDFITRTIIIDHVKPTPRNLSEVCIVTTGSFSDEVEEANAHLIAAAPDLLEALEGLESYAPTIIGESPSTFDKGLHSAIVKAKAAMKKAKGE